MLQIRERSVGDVTVLHLSGRLVLENEEVPLRAEVDRLVEAGRLKFVLDLREVTYIDSAGLGILVAKFVSVRRRGGDLRLVHLTPRSSRLMAITNLTTIFSTFDSDDAAVRSFDADR
jgi:anti-anti-sigma factor